MNDPTGVPHPSTEPVVSTLREGGHTKAHSSHDLANTDRGDPIKHRLEIVQSHIDRAIESCIRRESHSDDVETVAPWQFAPRHLTEIDSLRRLRLHLERLASRLRPARSRRGVPNPSDPHQKLDQELTECADTMIQRFEVSDTRHDLQASLEADMCKFESLLDERDLM